MVSKLARRTAKFCECRQSIRQKLGHADGSFRGLGVDRLGYTEGHTECSRAVNDLMARYPRFRSGSSFIQVAAPCRTKIDQYRSLVSAVAVAAVSISTIGAMPWPSITVALAIICGSAAQPIESRTPASHVWTLLLVTPRSSSPKSSTRHAYAPASTGPRLELSYFHSQAPSTQRFRSPQVAWLTHSTQRERRQ